MGTGQTKVSRKTAMGLKRGGRDFMDSPGFPHYHVNRPKIVGSAQRKVSRKTAMGLKGGGGGGDFMDSPGSLTFM